ncbi:hypothetical protein D3C81_2187640 [compost metagenome]
MLSVLEKTSSIPPASFKLDYGELVEEAIGSIQQELQKVAGLPNHRWVALQLMEQNPVVLELLGKRIDTSRLL